MKLLNLQDENLEIDWLTFKINGFTDPKLIASGLSNQFTPDVTRDDKPLISYHGLKNKHKVSIRQYTGSEGYWVGTKIIFSGENAAYLYKLIKMQKFDWKILLKNQSNLTLSRIDICYSQANVPNDVLKNFDTFLINCRRHIVDHTTTKYTNLANFPDGKMLKVNRRNNSVHYRIYQKNQNVRFELELKYRQTRLVQNYLFNNQIDIFENKLVHQFFKSSEKYLRVDSPCSNWIVDFKRRSQDKTLVRSLVTSYFKNKQITNQTKAERLFHLLQFLSFIDSLELNIVKNRQKLKTTKLENQLYYEVRFSLSQFLKFTGLESPNKYERDKLIKYFHKLQKLDPIVKIFSDQAFQSYACFPFVGSENLSGKHWVLKVFVAEELFYYPYPFRLPKLFLHAKSKNDLKLKTQFLGALAVNEQEKVLNLENFFNGINADSNRLLKIKKSLIQLLKELVEVKIISDDLTIVLKRKRNNEKKVSIKSLTTFDITRRIKYLKFMENIKD